MILAVIEACCFGAYHPPEIFEVTKTYMQKNWEQGRVVFGTGKGFQKTHFRDIISINLQSAYSWVGAPQP